jgi:hypothetical protein
MTIAQRLKSKRASTRVQAKREMRMNAMLTEELGEGRIKTSLSGEMPPNRETGGRFLTQAEQPWWAK